MPRERSRRSSRSRCASGEAPGRRGRCARPGPTAGPGPPPAAATSPRCTRMSSIIATLRLLFHPLETTAGRRCPAARVGQRSVGAEPLEDVPAAVVVGLTQSRRPPATRQLAAAGPHGHLGAEQREVLGRAQPRAARSAAARRRRRAAHAGRTPARAGSTARGRRSARSRWSGRAGAARAARPPRARRSAAPGEQRRPHGDAARLGAAELVDR